MKIRKTKGTAILNGNVVDNLEDNSTTNAPSQRAVSEAIEGTKSKRETLWTGSFSVSTTNAFSYLTLSKNVYDYDFLLIDVGAGDSLLDRTTVMLLIEGKGVTCGTRSQIFYLLESYAFAFGVQTDGLNKVGLMVRITKNYNVDTIKMTKIVGVKL